MFSFNNLINAYLKLNKRFDSITLIILLLLSFSVSDLQAQREYGDVGIGAQIGQPTGVSIKLYKPTTSLDLLAAWDLGDFFFLNAHAIFDTHLNVEESVHFFYGPGGYIGIRGRSPADDEVEIGVSGSFGLDFIIEKFEVFLQITPRLSLVESTDFDMGGGVGFRVYL